MPTTRYWLSTVVFLSRVEPMTYEATKVARHTTE